MHAASIAHAHDLFLAGDTAQAGAVCRTLLDQAFAAEADPDSTGRVADAATLMVRIARRGERLDDALRFCDVALTAAVASADPGRECMARAQHARTLSVLGQTEAALKESYAALRAALPGNQPRHEAAGLEALADAQWSMSQWSEALANYTRLLQLGQACGDVHLQATAHGGLGGMNHHLGALAHESSKPQAAQAHFALAASHALEFQRCAQAGGDVYNMRTAAFNHAVALLGLGDTVGARAALQGLMARMGKQEQATRGLALKNIGDIDLQEGHVDDAIARLREALALCDACGQLNLSMECCESLANACEAAADPGAALAYHRRQHALYVQVASASAQAHARAMAVQFETERAQAVALAQRSRADQLESSNTSLSLEAERLMRMSLEDALTGIGNRRQFDRTMLAADAAPGPSQPASLALLDIDHFKRINDQHSHQVGDAVLRRIGAILAANSRRDDLAARYGGEEFALLLTGLEPAASRQVCERVRAAVEAEDWSVLSAGMRVTVSIGLAHRAPGPASSSMRGLIAVADRRLYAAKHAGRNLVVDEGMDTDTPAPPA